MFQVNLKLLVTYNNWYICGRYVYLMKAIIKRKSAMNESPPPKTTASINENEGQNSRLFQIIALLIDLINYSLDAL